MIALLQSIHKPGRRLWDQWKEPETSETISSATLIVMAVNDFTRPIHDRMPVLLGREDHDAWLTGKAGAEILRPAPNNRTAQSQDSRHKIKHKRHQKQRTQKLIKFGH